MATSVQLKFTKAKDNPVGIRFEKRDYDGEAPTVVEVHPGSLAERVGICAGDRIEAINGHSQVNALHTARVLREAEGEIVILISRPTDAASTAQAGTSAARAHAPDAEEVLRFTKYEGESVGLRFSAEQPSTVGGVLVEDVRDGSIADRAGLRAGDVIRSINGQRDIFDSASAARILRTVTGVIEVGRIARAPSTSSARSRGAGAVPTAGAAADGAKAVEPPAAAPPPAALAPATAAAAAAPEEGFFTGLVRALSFNRSSAAPPKSVPPAPQPQPPAPAAAQPPQQPSQPPPPPAAAGAAAAGAPRVRRPSWTEQLAANLADFNIFDLGAKERREREAKEARALEEARAATSLQSAARGRAARLDYQRRREAAIELQAGARGQHGRREAKRLRDAASRAQAGWRGRNARVEARKRRAAKAAASGGGGGLVRRMSFGRPTAGGSNRNSGAGAGPAAKPPPPPPAASANGSTPRESIVGGLVRRLSFGRKK